MDQNEGTEEVEAVAVQKRSKRKKASVLLGAKSLNRVMRAVWPVVVMQRSKKGRTEAAILPAAEKALEVEQQSGAKEELEEETEHGGFECLNEDATSLAEGLNLCDLLEAAVGERAVVSISSDRTLFFGEDLRQQNPSCDARVICINCHDERECALLESAAAAGVRVDLGELLLGEGDVLELDRDVDGILEELGKRHPDCHLRICCERCHSTTRTLKLDDLCSDCTVIEGDVFHEEGCRSAQCQT